VRFAAGAAVAGRSDAAAAVGVSVAGGRWGETAADQHSAVGAFAAQEQGGSQQVLLLLDAAMQLPAGLRLSGTGSSGVRELRQPAGQGVCSAGVGPSIAGAAVAVHGDAAAARCGRGRQLDEWKSRATSPPADDLSLCSTGAWRCTAAAAGCVIAAAECARTMVGQTSMHVFLRLLLGWRNLVDSSRVVGWVGMRCGKKWLLGPKCC
jgi:hypothetical protein